MAEQFLPLWGLAQEKNNTVADPLIHGNRKNKRDKSKDFHCHFFMPTWISTPYQTYSLKLLFHNI